MDWSKIQASFRADLEWRTKNSAAHFLANSYSGMSIYQDGFSIRTREYLEADFPETLKRLPLETRVAILQKYAAENICTQNAADFGENFSDFLARASLPEGLSYLPDLAKLEWAFVQAFYAADLPEFDQSSLSSFDEDELLKARFIFDPSLCFLASPWPLVEIYEGEGAFLKSGLRTFLVYRERGEAIVREASEEETCLIQGLYLGLNLAHFSSQGLILEPEVFSDWLSSGLLRAIIPANR